MFINKEAEMDYQKQLLELVNEGSDEMRTPTPQDEYLYNLCRPERLH